MKHSKKRVLVMQQVSRREQQETRYCVGEGSERVVSTGVIFAGDVVHLVNDEEPRSQVGVVAAEVVAATPGPLVRLIVTEN